MEKNKKKLVVLTATGGVLGFLVVLLTGIFGVTPVIQGLKDAIKSYWESWTLINKSGVALVVVTILLFDIIFCLVHVIYAIVKKKYVYLVTVLGLFLEIAFLPFLFLLTYPQLKAGNLTKGGFFVLFFLSLFMLIAIIILLIALKGMYAKEEQKAKTYNGLSEKEVRMIVEKYIEEHEEKFHSKEEEPAPAPAPVVEEPVQEEPVQEEPEEEPAPEEEEAQEEDKGEVVTEGNVGDVIVEGDEEFEIVEVTDESGNKVKIKRRRKASFETKLRGSEFDLRHKYYDLRDYIKWYGLSNRISIPGDSFSYKRKKYAFITIVGKRIKLYIALDPAKYEDSPIPVERATAKKYVDIPCVLRIKSDLSYRRAKKLVDEAMSNAGIAKPEGDAPKETQHPEKK